MGDDPDQMPAIYARALNMAIAGRPADMTVSVHTCRGNFKSTFMATGGYDAVAETVFTQIETDGFFLEYDDARSGGFEPLRFMPKGRKVVLGLVSSKLPALESKDNLKRRIEEATKYVDLQNLCLSPQCGFASTHHGNKMTLDDLASSAAGINWQPLLQGLGVSETSFVVQQPSFIETFAQIWQQVPLQAWQDYYTFKTVDAFAGYLSDAFVQAQFDFEGRVLGGQTELEPRWKRGVGAIDSSLGEVVGKLYVEQHFQEASKLRMDQLIENLRAAFKSGIDELEWMTPETKTAAQEKLAKFNTKIGYPNSWKDYSALAVEPGDLVGNVMRSRRVEHQREIDKLGKPINRDEWFMTTYTVNAYYNPPMNEVVFPAAILQPPFFNVAADDAVNYGGIGAVIGHEFSHGFDDQGRKYDGNGNLRDWWTEADATAFSERANKLVAQYNQFEVLPGKFLNGDFTLGENIGDLSGLAVAYRAYKMSLNGQEDEVIDGFTGDQRFFIGWAQVWRRLYREENLEVRLTSDPHSHSEARANGVLRNFEPWYQAFNVQPGNKLYLAPEERVKIW